MEEAYLPGHQPHHQYSPSPLHSPTTPASSPGEGPRGVDDAPASASLDYDVVVILAAMICALVCALGLNSTLRCAVRCALANPAARCRRAAAGLKREHVAALPVATYTEPPPAAAAAGCAICLSDFAGGERVRVLPVCGHRFHVACVDRWLASRSSCPTCRRCLSPPPPPEGGVAEECSLDVLTSAP